LPPELLAQKDDLLKDRVAIEMKRYFKRDFYRIGHATRVARYAERIGKSEKGNMAVILSAAYLHDIGILEAVKKYGNTTPEQHEKEGPLIAKTILQNLGAKQELINEVCDIIAHHHHPGADESLNFKIVYDADQIENLDEKQKQNPMDTKQLQDIIEQSFLTASGREIARDVLLN
jgi:HD superfamily phosphodiesterase